MTKKEWVIAPTYGEKDTVNRGREVEMKRKLLEDGMAGKIHSFSHAESIARYFWIC